MIHNQALNTSIQEHDADSVDIKRFDYGRQRFNTYLLGFILLGAIIGSHVFGNATAYLTEKLNYNERITNQYNHWKIVYESIGKVYKRSYDEYFESLYNSYFKNQLRFLALAHTAWLMPFIVLCFWRAPIPIRYNRKKQLIYTWHWGKFYSATPDQLASADVQEDLYATSSLSGPLEISLFTKGRKKAKRFRLGAYTAYIGQNSDLKEWLNNYMNHREPSEYYRKQQNTFFEKCPRAPKKFPERKTEDMLDNL
ncbi:hypothetical protein WN093_02435 [Gammaproteobacteria bacterium AS21]